MKRRKSKAEKIKNHPQTYWDGDEQLALSKIELCGFEMLEKRVSRSGNCGRVYLPPEWMGKRIKIVRVE